MLTIDIVSDVVCPWCYIGKRKLEAALALPQAADLPPVQIRWHPFQLNPGLPEAGMPRQQYLEEKLGGPARAAEMYARVHAAGSAVGLDLNFDAIKQQANTLAAHALIAFAQASHEKNLADGVDLPPRRAAPSKAAPPWGAESHTKWGNVGASLLPPRRAAPSKAAPPRGAESHTQWANVGASLIKESLLKAYFVEGRFIGSMDVLTQIATQAGLDGEAARAYIGDTANRAAVAQADAQARQMGVSGVPFFIFNQKVAVSGAQDPQALLAAMRQAVAQAAEPMENAPPG